VKSPIFVHKINSDRTLQKIYLNFLRQKLPVFPGYFILKKFKIMIFNAKNQEIDQEIELLIEL